MSRDPKATATITAESNGLGAKLREAKAKFVKFGGELKKEVFGKDLVNTGFLSKGGASLIGNLGANAISSATGALSSFVIDQTKDVLSFNDALKRLEITANASPEQMNAFAQSVRLTSSQVGIGAKEILDGAAAYVALTGDMDGAAKASNQWARVAQATNSTVADIAQTAAALKQQLNIKPEEMEATFSALASQGKAGAIELKDLAQQLSSIAPQWAQFAGGKGVEGVRQLGAALQIVKRGFGGDASETITGLQSFLNALVKNAARFQKSGIKIFEADPKTGEKHLRNVLDIVNAIATSRLAKDPTKLEKALGRVEAYRAFIQLKENRQEMDRMYEVSKDTTVIQRDLAKYTQSQAGQTKIAMEEAKNKIAEAFTPEVINSFTTAMIAATQVGANLAVTVAGIVKGIQLAAEGFARFLGNETEDDKAARLQAEHRDDRLDQAFQTIGRSQAAAFLPNEGGEQHSKRIFALANKQLEDEDNKLDNLVNRVRAGKPAEFAPPTLGTGEGGIFNSTPFGPLAGKQLSDKRPFTKAELSSQLALVLGSQDTNKGQQVNVLAGAITKMNENNEKLARILSFFDPSRLPKFNLNIGGNGVATAVDNAPQNASRPNGP